MLVGVISDTHGVLPEWVESAFAGVERILHAGDVGNGFVLELLESIAPVTAVRGNMDRADGPRALPDHARVVLGGVRVLVVHRRADTARLLLDEDADVVITGHSHRPLVEEHGGRLFVNPGTAGDDRGAGMSVALLSPESGVASATIVRASG